jgi:NIPSNAP
MIYRMRIYQAVPASLPAFHDLFRTHLLPIQQRHGARLIGRWQTDDDRVVAIWQYDDQDASKLPSAPTPPRPPPSNTARACRRCSPRKTRSS